MANTIKELREIYEGVQDRLSDRELRILSMMRDISKREATIDRDETVKNLKRGLANHLAGSTFKFNSMVIDEEKIPNLELREVVNLIKKLEMWELMYLPKFQIPFWSGKIFGETKENLWVFFEEIYEGTLRAVKKVDYTFITNNRA